VMLEGRGGPTGGGSRRSYRGGLFKIKAMNEVDAGGGDFKQTKRSGRVRVLMSPYGIVVTVSLTTITWSPPVPGKIQSHRAPH